MMGLTKPAKAMLYVSSNKRVALFWDMTSNFRKSPKTLDEQVNLLESRGMIIRDREKVKFHLQHLNYYRLRAYWINFESDLTSHQFQEHTEFDQVLKLYIFDRNLRLLILESIEQIEVSVRTQWAYYLAHSHGSHAHLNRNLFDYHFYERNLDDLTREINRSDEIFVKHFDENYPEYLPPVWVVCELMSFGLLSRWFKSIRSTKIKNQISNIYHIKSEFFQSWLHHLTMIRNVCAHHSRLWNKEFTILPMLIHNSKILISTEFVKDSRKIHNTLVILNYLTSQISPESDWQSRLTNLLCQNLELLESMDFPQDWQGREFWN